MSFKWYFVQYKQYIYYVERNGTTYCISLFAKCNTLLDIYIEKT